MSEPPTADMTPDERAERIRGVGLQPTLESSLCELRGALLPWYERHRRDLPWRGTSDPYRILVSEIMLQQTQVERVVPYFERFTEALPSVEALAEAPLDKVLRLWEGLGYYARARNLHAAAQRIMARHGGRFPRDLEGALALPGVGEYTAGAVLSIAFGVPLPAVDANARRVLVRLFAVEGDPRTAPAAGRIDELARIALDRARPGEYNQAVMELGALLCVPGAPGCLLCPLSDLCLARLRGTEREIPPARREGTCVERAVAAVILRDGDVLVARRPEDGQWGGLWEFPGTALPDDRPDDEVLADHLGASLGIRVRVGPVFAEVPYGIMNRRVHLTVYECELWGGAPEPSEHTEVRWVAPDALADLAMPSPHRLVAERLQDR